MGIRTVGQAPEMVRRRKHTGSPSGIHSTVDNGDTMRETHTDVS